MVWIIGGVCYVVVAMAIAIFIRYMLALNYPRYGFLKSYGIAISVGLFWLVILVGLICFFALLWLFYWLRGGIRQKR